jgi:hypothetical protein
VDVTHIGITATRRELTDPQKATVTAALHRLSVRYNTPMVLHHGCCVGGDQWVAHQAQRLGWATWAHPATGVDRWQTPDTGDDVAREEPAPPLERNRAIVGAVSVLLACPADDYVRDPTGRPNGRQSGTWTTFRYAAQAGRRRAVILPDGTFLITLGWRRRYGQGDPTVFTDLRPVDLSDW